MFFRRTAGRHTFRIVFASVLCLLWTTLAWGSVPSVTLAWNPSPANNIAGYRLYLGLFSHNYATMLDVGATTNASLSNLSPGTTYFFAVTAYDTNGLESPFSGEISYLVPVLSNQARLKLSRPANGQVLLSGTAPVGYTYSIQSSTDLKKWTAAATVVAGADGSFSFLDTFRLGSSEKFYRALQIAP